MAAHYATRAERVQYLFDEVIDLPAGVRAAHLALACEGDSDLIREVNSLVEAFTAGAGNVQAILDGLAFEPVFESDHTDIDRLLYQRVSHYLILEKLGGGGMGVVYKAWDEQLDRTVALKFLTAHDRSTEVHLISEAKAISGLDHPNVAVIHEIGRMENGQHFIVMACYGGETLKEKISSGPLPMHEALWYTIQIAEGLKRAHEAGIVHRDVKPANVIVTDHGEVKLLDFGLAKESDVEPTRPGTRAGTPAYMSPEQIRGDAVDHRTDIWSLGVVLYEMLAGSKPFSAGRQPTLLNAILHEQPELIHARGLAVPGALEAVLHTALAKDPAQRYPDMNAFLIALQLVWPASENTGIRQP